MNKSMLALVFTIFLLTGMASLGYGQGAFVSLNYWDDGQGAPEPRLNCPCNNSDSASAYNDGTQVCLYWDNNNNGPDPSDVQPIGDGSNEYGHSNWNCFAMNGVAWELGRGYFGTDPQLVIGQLPTAPDTARYYLRVNSGGCCWTSTVWTFIPGFSEIYMTAANWTCSDSPCQTGGTHPNPPTNVQATDNTRCLYIGVSWQHDGTNISSFAFYDGNTYLESAPPDYRQWSLPFGDVAPHMIIVRAVNASGDSASAPDQGSTYLMRFADGPDGNIYGNNLHGQTRTIHYVRPEVQCPTRYLLQIYDTQTHNIIEDSLRFDSVLYAEDELDTVTLPQGNQAFLKLILRATSIDRAITLTDTTDSTFCLGICNEVSGVTGLMPDRFELAQNFPNPFNPETRIEFSVPIQSDVKVEVFNINGQLVKTLVDGNITAGIHQITWNGVSNGGISVSSGLYLYRMTGPGFVQTKKMLLLK
jgi:hypothetical protein